jgi:hypothetical protein
MGKTRNPKPEIRMNDQNQSSTLRLRPEGKPKERNNQQFRISGFAHPQSGTATDDPMIGAVR